MTTPSGGSRRRAASSPKGMQTQTRRPLPKKRAVPRTHRCPACSARISTSVCPECKTRKATTRTSIGKRCDTIWSQIIKAPGKCFRCGAVEGLQAAHIIGRAQRVVRWDLRNGICLCHTCHRLFDTYRIDRHYLISAALENTVGIDLFTKAQGVWDKQFPLAELTAALAAAKEKAV